jgi:hypothetical protein
MHLKRESEQCGSAFGSFWVRLEAQDLFISQMEGEGEGDLIYRLPDKSES